MNAIERFIEAHPDSGYETIPIGSYDYIFANACMEAVEDGKVDEFVSALVKTLAMVIASATNYETTEEQIPLIIHDLISAVESFERPTHDFSQSS